jgi:WD40 repeat protein
VLRLLEVASGRQRHHLRGHLGRVLFLTFSADRRRLVSASEETTAPVWDLAAALPAGTPVSGRSHSIAPRLSVVGRWLQEPVS